MNLTTLIAWHDSGWNGRICRNPKENKYCESFRHIKKTKFGYYMEYGNKKIDELKCENNARKLADEIQYNGKKWSACGSEVNIFYKYKFNSMVYGWTEKYDNIDILKDIFLDLWINFYYNNDALCFLYCRENPVSDNKILVACVKPKIKKISIVCDIGNGKFMEEEINEEDFNKLNNFEFYKSLFSGLRYIRIYPHLSIEFRPEDIIFTIPYQELGEYFGFENIPENLILEIPNEMKKSFLYTTNFLPNEFSCLILEKALDIIKNINKMIEEDNQLNEKLKMFRNVEIDKYEERIKNHLEKLKKLKFNYPGLASVLRYLGKDDAILTYINAVKNKNEEEMYREVKEALENNKENEKWGINRSILNNFNRKPKPIREFLINHLPYYNLTKSQIDEIIKQHYRGFINIEKILENPYLLYEELKPKDNLLLDISFWEIDNWELRRLGEDNFDITNKHRIRAMLIATLKKALSDGHTALPLSPKDLPSVKKDLKYYYSEINEYLPENVKMDFDRFLELIEEHIEFIKEKIWIDETEFEDELGRKYNLKLFELKEIREKEEYIEDFINKMLEKSWNVKTNEEEIKEKLKSLGKPKNIPENVYEKAIEAQAKAVKTLLENGCSVLTGPAGTGKTSVIEVLLEIICENERLNSIIILAPTGKATVRVKKAIRNILNKYSCIKEPTTIHSFIKDCGRFDWNYMEFKIENKKQVDVLIIDEASMVETELLYNLLQCIDMGKLKRIIFIGDINQLPPVEAGKPFFDIYQYLKRKEINGTKEYVAELKTCLRTESTKIIELSKIYLNIDKEDKYKVINELFSSSCSMNGFTKYCLRDNEGKERVVVLVWNEDPYKALEYAIDEIIKEYNGNPDNYKDFFKYFVYKDKVQILTYTKNKGNLSSYWINYWVRDDSKYTENVRDSFIMYQFTCDFNNTFADKVIQTKNYWKLKVWNYKRRAHDYGIFNGMMGYVSRTRNKELVVKFYYPEVQAYIYKSYRVGNRYVKLKDTLEYAYAITTHKSQGSEFENVIFILPKSGNISKELIYTAITRAKKKLFIITNNLENLLNAGKYSEVIERYSVLFDSPIDPRYYPEYLRIITLRGDIVRSWQECLIANLLYYEAINHEYEVLYKNMLPDFKINSKYENKIIFWEHLGMIDNEKYKKDAEEKLKTYIEDGFYIMYIKDIDKESFENVFKDNNKILIVSTTEDVRNSKELYNKIKILKKYL